MRHFHSSYLKANKVWKNEETTKVGYAYYVWKCADAVYQQLSSLVHACEITACQVCAFFEETL